MTEWSLDVDNLIYSIVRARCEKDLKKSYPNLRFTNEDFTEIPAKFPTIKIKATSISEVGSDLSGDNVNAVNITIQVDVFTNTKQKDANAIMSVLFEQFKKMRFKISSMPIPIREADIYRSVMRVQRVIGSADKF